MRKPNRIKTIFCLVFLLPLLIGCNYMDLASSKETEGGLARNGSYINEASEQLAIGNVELAYTYFKQAIVYEEELPLAWRGIGMIYFHQNEFEAAKEALERALELGGKETSIIYNMLGVIAMRKHDFQSAINFFNIGIELFDLELEEKGITIEDLKAKQLSTNEVMNVDEPDINKLGINGINTVERDTNIEVLQSMMANRILANQRLANWEEARYLARLYLNIFPEDELIKREYEFLRTR
jgi:tetratricopeptide (TPR) repeat protein